MSLTPLDILIRLLAAWACGILLGMERRRRGKPIGAVTYVLISLAACSIAIASAYGFTDAIAAGGESDPARLVVGIITGMGFLGAGVIWRSPRGAISGLTTAADLWATACLGILWGLGAYFLAGVTFAMIMITLLVAKHTKIVKQRIRWLATEHTTSLVEPAEESVTEPTLETNKKNKKNSCQNGQKPL